MLQCPEPGCERQFKNAAGLSGHLRQIHGKGGKMSVSVPIADFAALQKDVESLGKHQGCLLYTSTSPRDRTRSRMPSSA